MLRRSLSDHLLFHSSSRLPLERSYLTGKGGGGVVPRARSGNMYSIASFICRPLGMNDPIQMNFFDIHRVSMFQSFTLSKKSQSKQSKCSRTYGLRRYATTGRCLHSFALSASCIPEGILSPIPYPTLSQSLLSPDSFPHLILLYLTAQS